MCISYLYNNMVYSIVQNIGEIKLKLIKSSVIFLFLLILTMGVVCAEDANQTAQDTLELTDTQDVISDASEKSFTDLFDAINKSKTQELDRFIFGLGIRFVGAKASKTLAKTFKTLKG